ncbi:MAG: ABC transporter ATP-binding protein [Pseudomonadota bacterium]
MGTLVVDSVSKAFKRYPGKWARAREWITSKQQHEKTWVLREVSFRADPGDALGIVGMNGAGKSTLLKIVTGTTQPTSGSVAIQGRVAALLELGMGFHPDFTGRQNVLMAGQLLGLSVAEIVDCLPAIEEFAEIGDYIERPVRLYSSGMQMRLAFSVATAIRPDVLIVDEALSVGDAYFQHKSFDRIREFRDLGTTLLFVSHDRSAVQSLCDRTLLLERGFVIKDGPPEEVMDYYNAVVAERENQTVEVERTIDGRARTRSGTGEAQVAGIRLLDENENPVDTIDVGQNVILEIQVGITESIPRLVLGYGIKDRLGQVMFGTNTHHTRQPVQNLKPGDSLVYRICFAANIGPGSYSVQTALVSTDTHLVNNYEWQDLALVFNVLNSSRTEFSGCNWLEPEIEISPA